MATQEVSIIGRLAPDNSGDVFWQPYSVLATTAAIDPMVLVFQDSAAKDGARGFFTVPQDYAGTPQLVVVWTANATTGTMTVDLSFTARSGTEDMDAAAGNTDDTVTDTKTSTAFAREEAVITSMSTADFAAGDNVFVEVFRDSVTDSLAVSAIWFDVLFRYSDT